MDELLPKRSAPWTISRFQRAPFPEPPNWLSARVAAPPDGVRQELEERGFTFLRTGETATREASLNAAASLIALVPSLAIAVHNHVRHMSLLAADEAYDISHSEPRWPDWIFVSCPVASGQASTLRLGENVVHEAMHLQLTAIEREMPLVVDEVAKLHSPWMDEPRDLRGILHGVYVFRCLALFFDSPELAESLTADGFGYACRRRDEIAAEIAAIDKPRLRDGLTEGGRAFFAKLVA